MSSNIKITYTNRAINLNSPKIFIFAKNEIASFDVLKEGYAWKVIEKIGCESSCEFEYPIATEVCAAWNNGECKTKKMTANIGEKYVVKEDNTGIIIDRDDNATNSKSIDVCNKIHVKNGVSVQLYKTGRLLVTKKVVGFDQKATFILKPKLYWGIASEIKEGQALSSAIINSHNFYELNLEGVSEIKLGLYCNPEYGYHFKIEKQY